MITLFIHKIYQIYLILLTYFESTSFVQEEDIKIAKVFRQIEQLEKEAHNVKETLSTLGASINRGK